MSIEDYENSGVPKRHMNFRPETDNVDKNWMRVYTKIKDTVDKGSLFAIVGNRGTGKTQIGSSLIGYVTINLNMSAMYKKAFDIFLRIRESMNAPGDSEIKAVNEFINKFFLVIDSFEVRSETPFENRILDHIIDRRYDLVKPTLIISNDTLDNFVKIIGPSVVDRIRETGGIIEMSWQSYRIKKDGT